MSTNDDIDLTDGLSAAVIDETPTDYDFSTGYPEEWEIAFRLDEDERHVLDEYEPMMNTIWPLPDGFDVPDDVRDRLETMTVVRYGTGEYGLALTGGGMDLSWSIARTYVNLGYLPPAELGSLPNMSGKDYDSESNRRAIAALRASHTLMIDRHKRDIDDLDRLGE